MTVTVKAEIKNMTERERPDGFIVARRCWNPDKKLVELWYYGFYTNEDDAQEAAHEIGNGFILEYTRD